MLKRISAAICLYLTPLIGDGGAKDPGVRQNEAPSAVMVPGLIGGERELFRKGLEAFKQVHSVQRDSLLKETEAGLGPGFNLDSCAGCHAQPVIGGSSPKTNPQVLAARKEGAKNRIPKFLRINGPVLQARARLGEDGTPDGKVVALFTIAGRSDAAGCDFRRPDLDEMWRRNNLSFRIPTPLFGAGLVEAIPDSEILQNLSVDAELKKTLGIRGRPNREVRDGAIGRFGWKAQERSLEQFAAEAYLTEQGVTSELFPEEVGNPPANCRFNPVPEDRRIQVGRRGSEQESNVTRLSHFMRFLAPLPPSAESSAIQRGKAVFESLGCHLCHVPELKRDTVQGRRLRISRSGCIQTC